MKDLAPAGGQSVAYAINNAREVVGTTTDFGAFLFKQGTLYHLQDLVPPDSEFIRVLASAFDINESGQILALAYREHDYWKGFGGTLRFSCSRRSPNRRKARRR